MVLQQNMKRKDNIKGFLLSVELRTLTLNSMPSKAATMLHFVFFEQYLCCVVGFKWFEIKIQEQFSTLTVQPQSYTVFFLS